MKDKCYKKQAMAMAGFTIEERRIWELKDRLRCSKPYM